MEKHTCKLCFRRFSNGRALGGHMRSHVSSAAAATTKQPPPTQPPPPPMLQDSSSSSPLSPSSEEAEQVARVVAGGDGVVEMEGKNGHHATAATAAYYGLRENPRKSFKVVDPEFSSSFPAVDYAFFLGGGGGGGGGGAATNNNNSSSVVVQDRESETESSKAPSSFRRRSKRRRRYSPMPPPPKPDYLLHHHHNSHPLELEPVSSVSDTTPDEDVALCLMMLSRDIWSTKTEQPKQELNFVVDNEEKDDHQYQVQPEPSDDEGEEDEEDEEEEERIAAVRSRKGGRSRYQCGTCKKVFRSYQALGGHRASHKKVKTCIAAAAADGGADQHEQHQIQHADPETNAADPRIHECPFCFRVFVSGQALGGHKRSHLTSASSVLPPPVLTNANASAATAAASTTSASAAAAAKFDSFIDLNLPAPMEEGEEGSLVEQSAVSDAE